MPRKIGIIGMGNVGAAIAHGLISQGIADDYVFIDTKEEKVLADAVDFEDAMANLSQYASITVNDYQALADADVVISSLGKISLQNNKEENRFGELPFTSQEAIQVAKKLKEVHFSGILVVISNPVDVITSLYQHYSGLPKERVFGTGTLLDTARMKRAVGKQFQLSPKSVEGYALGEHGNSQFVAWSQVAVKGQAITTYLEEEELEQLDYQVMRGGYTVFYGKGYTSYGIAAAAIRLVQAILNDEKALLPLSHYVEELDCYLGYPALVGRQGIQETISLNLTEHEKEKLALSAQIIKNGVEAIIKKL